MPHFSARAAYALAAATLFAAVPVGASTLTGDTSRPEVSTFSFGEPITLAFHATEVAAGTKLLLDFADEHEKVFEHRELPVAPDTLGTWNETTTAPASRYGFYRVYAKLSDGTLLAKLSSRPAGYISYAVVEDPAKRVQYPQNVTRFGMQGGFGAGSNAVLPYMGIRWVMGSLGWGNYEPDHSGQFAEKAKAAEVAGKAFPDRSPVIEDIVFNGKKWGVYTYPSMYSAPKWASEPGQKSGNGILTPTGEVAWAKFAHDAAAAHAKLYTNDPKHYYQITWEPDFPWGFQGTPAQLVKIYEIAYKAIHEADPSALVFGPTYGGLGGDGEYAQTEALLKLGFGKYIDGYSVHGYFGFPPERNGFVERVRAYADLIRKYTGKDLPRVNSEQGHPTGEDESKELEQAQCLTRENLILLGEGYQFSILFYITDYPGEPGYGYYYNLDPRTDFGSSKIMPKPIVPVYSTQSYLLEGSTSAGAIEWLSPTTLGYAFDCGGVVTLAVWDYGDKPRQVSIPVGTDQVTVYDWMGNSHAQAAPGGSLSVSLGPEPTYIVGASPAMWGLKAQRPIQLPAKRIVGFPGMPVHIAAKLLGSTKSFDGVALLTPDGRLSSTLYTKPAKVSKGGSTDIGFDVAIPDDAEIGGYSATIVLRDKNQRIVAGDGVRIDVRSPASIVGATPTVAGNKRSLAVALREEQHVPLDGTVTTRLEGVPGTKQTTPFQLTSNGTGTVNVDFSDADIVATKVYKCLIAVQTASGYKFDRTVNVNFLSAPHVTAPPTIDGDPADWAAVPVMALSGKDAVVRSPQFWTGDADLSAVVRYAWDEKALYLSVDVTDDVFLQDNTGFDTWRGDCLQLGFDLDAGKAVTTTGNLVADIAGRHRSSEIDLALTKLGPEAYRTSSYDGNALKVGQLTPQELKVAVVHRDGKLYYEASIPWITLGRGDAPKPGERIGVALTANDMDTPKQTDPKAVGLFGGIAAVKDITQYGVMTLGN